MPAATTATTAPPASWRLRRNCSLTPRQALAAWSPAVLGLLAVAVFWAVQGWWWVSVFALVNMAGLAAALCCYTRHALDGDTLALGDDGMLYIEQQCGAQLRRVAWRASLVRMDVGEGRGGAIVLRAGRERLEVGARAAPPQRDLAARELRSALRLAPLRRP
ncbi:MAG: DUF2244 domain-containing protein [Rubrivivax sp.]|nr:MAG: DUF2244 domain-containing protein [Rubrivivax sp.]